MKIKQCENCWHNNWAAYSKGSPPAGVQQHTDQWTPVDSEVIKGIFKEPSEAEKWAKFKIVIKFAGL